MTAALAAATAAVTMLYVALGLGAAWAARRERARPPLPEADLPHVSVLVAARNEEDALPRCLDALTAQRYPREKIRFVIADDGSADRTAEIAAARAAQDNRFHLVRVPPAEGPFRGKAHALHHALGHAHGGLLLTTDADCAPPPGWARNLASQFADERVGVVCGVTLVEGGSTRARLQALDWLLVLTVAAGASAAGRPLTAMGNNMAVRRAAYDAVGGFPSLPFSVTEDYALFQAVHRAGWDVRLVLDEALRNSTLPLPTLRQAFGQRKRWARGGLAAPPWAWALYLVIGLAHGLLLVGLLVAPLVAVPLLLLKVATDAVVLAAGARRMGVHVRLGLLPIFEAYLFGYLLLMPAALLFAPRIRWKGRRF